MHDKMHDYDSMTPRCIIHYVMLLIVWIMGSCGTRILAIREYLHSHMQVGNNV